jgi:hypothetical protein
MPENLRGYSALIWTAYNTRTWVQKDGKEIALPQRDPFAFKQGLEEKGVALASVTKEEAERSHRNSEYAREIRSFAPRYKEGEIVAVTEQGYIYKLSQRTTGHDRRAVEAFLKPIDRTPLQGIEATRETLKVRAEERNTRVEERNVEVQAFREILRDTKNAERMKRATQPAGKGRTWSRKGEVAAIFQKGVSVTVGAQGTVLGAADKIADAVSSLFAPVLTPEQKLEGEIAGRVPESEGRQRIDFSRYTAERAQAVQREEGHLAERENERRDQGRDR